MTLVDKIQKFGLQHIIRNLLVYVEMVVQEKKDIYEFFILQNKEYVCQVVDCRSKIRTLNQNALYRHFEQKHESRLDEVYPKRKSETNLERLRQKIIFICVKHVTVCGRPIKSLQDESFEDLLAFQLDQLNGTDYKLTLNEIHKNINSWVHEMAENIRRKIGAEFNKSEFAITFDSTTKHKRAILGTNIQKVYDGKILMRSIGMQHIMSTHKGTHLAKMVVELCEKLNISLRTLVAVTTDNAKNMKTAVEYLDSSNGKASIENNDSSESDDSDSEFYRSESMWSQPAFQNDLLTEAAKEICSNYKPIMNENVQHVSCAAHSIQLAVKHGLDKSNCLDVIENARSLVKELRLQPILIQLKRNHLPLPPMDVVTRWSSVFLMVDMDFNFHYIFSDVYKLFFFSFSVECASEM